jgi:putative transcriptional regulator
MDEMKKRLTPGEELIQAAEEALAIVRGETSPARVHVPPPVDVKAIRTKLRMTQTAFAETLGTSVSGLRKWEQGTRQPRGAARSLLILMDHAPELVRGVFASTRGA